MAIITTILIFIVVLGLLVFVHELGHFAVSKFFKVGVEEFGFGYPPRIFGIKKGKTLYSINWIPVGGFVKIKGVIGAEEGTTNDNYKNDEDSFMNKPVWQRFSILFAGVVMNFILAVVLFSFGFMIGMPAATSNLPDTARVKDQKVVVMEILENTPAMEQLEAGDAILEVNSLPVVSIYGFKEATKKQEQVDLLISRNGEETTKQISVAYIDEIQDIGIGVALTEAGTVSYPWYSAIGQGFSYTLKLVKMIFEALFGIIANLFTSEKSGVDFAGPVGIAIMTNQMAQLGFIYILQFTALLSVNLAIFNLLPIPALDGGRLLFLIIEKIKGSPVNQKIETVIHNFGFMLLLLLIAVVTFRDLFKYEIFASIKNLFI